MHRPSFGGASSSTAAHVQGYSAMRQVILGSILLTTGSLLALNALAKHLQRKIDLANNIVSTQ